MKEAVAEYRDVTKRYASGWRRRPVLAVDGVTLRVFGGEIVGFVGPNRAGKSTLVKLLLTICRPTSGQITRFGQSWHDRNTLSRIGYIHESQSLPRYLTAAGLLDYYGAMSGLRKRTVQDRAGCLIERVGLTDRAKEPIGRYSKGMLQRLALAQALLNDPELLVFDEPTEGMDLAARQMVFEALVEQRRRGRSAILVSHALADVESLCDRVAVLRQGRVVHSGETGELRASGGRSFEQALETLYRAQGELVGV